MPRVTRGIWVLDVGVDVHCEDIPVGHGGGDASLLTPGVGPGPGDVDHHLWAIGVKSVAGPDGAGVVDHLSGGRAAVVAQADAAVGEDEVFFGGALGEGQGEGEKEEGGLGEVHCDCVNMSDLK